MRYKEITETPIENLEVHNMDREGSFPSSDRKLLSNPQHIQNIRKKFERMPHSFHMYFINREDVKYINDYEWHEPDPNDDDKNILVKHSSFSQQWGEDYDRLNGISNSETIKDVLGMTIPTDPDAITVVFTSNANDTNRISMSPWMIGHRLGHAILDSEEKLPEFMQNLIYELRRFVEKVPRDAFQFRSARTGQLQPGEIFPELIAQYCIGNLKLNLQKDPMLIHKQRSINVMIDRIMSECVGHIFIAL